MDRVTLDRIARFEYKARLSLQFLEEIEGPTGAEYVEVMRRLAVYCTRAADKAESMLADPFLRRHGFRLVDIGGGCDAYRKDYPEIGRYVLVTVDGDPQAPVRLDEPVLAGLYDVADDDGNALSWVAAGSLPALIALIEDNALGV